MRFLWIFAMLVLVGCQALDGGADVSETQVAGDAIYATTAADLARQSITSQTQVAATVVAVETESAAYRSVNDQLLATLSAGSTPTPALMVGQANPNTGGEVRFEQSDRLFIKTGVSTTVDDSGCVVNPATSFSSDITRLYATFRALNVAAGTPMRADWFYEGELRIQDDWRVPSDIDEACLWFELEASRTEFSVGQWQVALYVDEELFQLEDRMAFFINDS